MGLIWRPGFQFDVDASNYIEAVEAADEIASPGIGALETGARYAINDFVIGCKQDGIWSAIKASCILAGARTRLGALVPLKGTAPTSFNFVDGDYNRETGLVGDGSTKYLNSNRAGNADPQNSFHAAVYVKTAPTTASVGSNSYGTYIGNITGTTTGARSYFRDVNNGSILARNTSSVADLSLAVGSSVGLIGMQRSAGTSYVFRANTTSSTITQASQTPNSNTLSIYKITTGTAADTTYSNARLSFYSIGESLDLAALDGRVTDLMTAIGAAIP